MIRQDEVRRAAALMRLVVAVSETEWPHGQQMRMDEEAWRQGFLAGATGKSSDSNPYPATDHRGLAWASGYVEGKNSPDRLPQLRPMGPRINGSGGQ